MVVCSYSYLSSCSSRAYARAHVHVPVHAHGRAHILVDSVTFALRAALLVGIVIVPGAAGGIFFGGWLSNKLRLTPRQNALMCWVVALVAIPFLFGFFIGCDQYKLANNKMNSMRGCSLTGRYPSSMDGIEYGWIVNMLEIASDPENCWRSSRPVTTR
eukprot:6806-Amorphochlora_amoeboformis.AAC.1